MPRHIHTTEGNFGSAFGASTGCVLGIAFALMLLALIPVLFCAGCFGVGLWGTKNAIDQTELARQQHEQRQAAEKEAEAKAKAGTLSKPEPKIPGVGEWVQGVETRIRIENAIVGEPIFLKDGGKESFGEQSLLVYFAVENGSKARSLDYKRPSEGFTSIDSKGRSLKLRTGRGIVVKGDVGFKTLKPGESVVDILVFEPPSAGATHVDLVFPAVGDWSKGGQTFRIPASAWK